MMKKISVLLFTFSCLLAVCQTIKTIQLVPLHSKSLIPFVPLGNVLELSFDDLDADNKEYQYKIEHMTHDWKPSNLQSNQYVNGFDQNYIINVTNSFNTLQDYTHYAVNIPNQNSVITKSGNYRISVLDEDDEIVFSRRCVFYENITTVGVNVIRGRDTETTNQQQTVQFIVNHKGLNINNPNQEIKIQLIKNYNWKFAKTNLNPLFIKPQQLIYNYTQKTNFWGGNEYLNYDNKYVRSTNVNIAKTERKDLFNNYLYTDIQRSEKPYTYNPDINGQFIVRTLDANDQHTEADYALIHFSLETDAKIKDKNVYVYGRFNNYELTENNKMTFNNETNLYEASLQLKQGFYNYTYATLNENRKIDLNEINGSFFQTENEYTVIVYYMPFGGLYDRVIGVGYGFFNQNR